MAVCRYLRISARKLRWVIDTVRRKPVPQALSMLASLKNKGARMAEKVIKSAAANAKVLGMNEDRLYVFEIFADGGPVMKRFKTRSMGRADRILKRMAHLTVKIRERAKPFAGTGKNETKAAEQAAPKTQKKKQKAGAGAKA